LPTLKTKGAVKKRIEDFDEKLFKSIEDFNLPGSLHQAAQYALDGKGKRIRPLIVLLVADSLGKGFDVFQAAISAEYFHTASLIADDLPCMDNDEYRRDRPCLHKVFGEGTSLLTSYGFVSEAFYKIEEATTVLKQKISSEEADKRGMLALKIAASRSGMASGAVKGQFFDLFRPSTTFLEKKELIYLKTTTLFEAAFAFGWIFGGGDLEKMSEIFSLSHHFGLAFQMADDLVDRDQDEKRGDSFTLDEKSCLALCKKELFTWREKMEKLSLFSSQFEIIFQKLLK